MPEKSNLTEEYDSVYRGLGKAAKSEQISVSIISLSFIDDLKGVAFNQVVEIEEQLDFLTDVIGD